jgi:pantetheine-phosphate adenylyltransferase, bacterial
LKLAIYPGTFDPVTNGHLDVLERSLKIFDTVVLSVARDTGKQSLFSLEERARMLTEAVRDYPGARVVTFEGLLMNHAVSCGAAAIIRGLRAVSDFEYEFQMSMMNKNLNPDVETVFLMTSPENAFISSSMIRQVASLGGTISGLVPDLVEEALYRKFREQGE